MTILDYIAANPGCSGGEIAAALNTPTTTINAELRRLWRSGSVIRKERKTGGRFSYQVNPMPFGCSNPLTQMFNQLLRKSEHEHLQLPETTSGFSSSSGSKTNSINSCSGPFLHLVAGGLRTSVTRGLPQ